MREPRGLCDLARHKLAALRAAGCAVSDDDVVRLNALAWEIETPSNRRELSRGRPVAAGSYWLWPLTIAGAHWFESVGCALPMPDAALAYAMAHGRDDIATHGWAEVKRWYHGLTCTHAELLLAIAEVEEQDARDPTPDRARGDMTLGRLVAMMQAQHGGDAETWERYVSLGYVCDLIDTSVQQQSAGGGGNVWRDRANYVFACACREIERRERHG